MRAAAADVTGEIKSTKNARMTAAEAGIGATGGNNGERSGGGRSGDGSMMGGVAEYAERLSSADGPPPPQQVCPYSCCRAAHSRRAR